MTGDLTPLQERLRAHALRRIRSQRAQRIASSLAAFAETTDRFRYILDRDAEQALTHAVGSLLSRYSSSQLIDSEWLADTTFETLHRALTRLVLQNGISGEADLWFDDTLGHAAHVDFYDTFLGHFRADLADVVRATSQIVSIKAHPKYTDMALVAAERNWMIYIEQGCTHLLLTTPA